MNPPGFVKDEFPGLGPLNSGEPSMARPMEGLYNVGPTPFLTKTYELVDDQNTNHVVSWSGGNNSFVIWDSMAFSTSVLPSKECQNVQGFRKVDPDRWEFAHEAFLRGQKHLLKNIKRRKTPNSQSQTSQGLEPPCVEVGRFGLDAEIDRLRRDKQVLMLELVKLRQEQQNTRSYINAMEERLSGTEMKQRQMMGFLAKAMHNPSFLQKLIQQNDVRRELEEEICKKRRRPIEQGHGNVGFGVGDLGQGGEGGFGVKLGPSYNYGDISGLSALELEQLAGEIGGLSEIEEKMGEEYVGKEEELGFGGKEIGEGFWGDLLDDGIEGMGLLGGEGEDEEDVNVLVEHLDFLGSSP
ncbi:hypothetical protein RHSIM_Rhsim04G0197300 [Rhododendron simsii]|uniref:HSF-type DNA-binding domain-containing protein n=1 Tax=Rhododendron simsii TaxID=118357 RepID=A0A834LQD1_RHOSS|nr:hypothetical protein RHSIM_Rhsim04G0197300 [Rhododendron simsii]